MLSDPSPSCRSDVVVEDGVRTGLVEDALHDVTACPRRRSIATTSAPAPPRQNYFEVSSEDDGEDDYDDNDEAAPAPPPDTDSAGQVQSWAVRVPIGLGLCPWAGKAHSQGRLRYVTCTGTSPADAARLVAAEAAALTGAGVADLSSSLVVCPHVAGWHEFKTFEDWVTGFEKSCEDLTLVPFHPEFLRWRGLPDGIGVGSVVSTHWGFIGSKSAGTAPATIIDSGGMNPFGMRKVLVRFHESLEGRTPEQFVPIDWFDHSHSGAPLPDNRMHQAPHPTIHLIRNADLATMTLCDVYRVKRLNAERMLKLGWEGMMKRTTH